MYDTELVNKQPLNVTRVLKFVTEMERSFARRTEVGNLLDRKIFHSVKVLVKKKP